MSDHIKVTACNKNDIAVIGMSCRLPGSVESPAQLHQFLLAGGNGITDIPPERWDISAFYSADRDAPGKMYVRRGGFLQNLTGFDAAFFGISPKEAPYIDPQHRWLLETSYEALQDAGLDILALKGSDTSVYIGQFMHDFEQIQLDALAHDNISSHSSTGSSMTLTANRISYSFDFKGASLTLDTACSSSLVALDLACKSILNGDSQLALAGGVNLLLRPELTVSICKASMLSPDGYCKSFDASANGYVRSEGVAVVVLKRLADAIRDGDKVQAVIKASGVNQDGQTSGITVPNGKAQQALLEKTLAQAGLSGADIDYAEAHGTGTAVGDPIEVNALGQALGRAGGRPKDRPCLIGSVKSNIGHTEPTAGLAGMIKTIQAMNDGMIPANLHCQQLNPAIQPDLLNIQIVTTNTAWPSQPGQPRRAVVNSFGFGGTNANVVLEQAPAQVFVSTPAQPMLQLYLTARQESALPALCQAYLQRLETVSAEQLADFCVNSARRRSHYRHRLVISGYNKQELQQGLTAALQQSPHPALVKGQSRWHSKEPIALVFSGMGTTWPGMARQLYQHEPVFRHEIDRVEQALFPLTGWSLTAVMFATGQPELIMETEYAQPAIFAVQIGLVALMQQRGIQVAAMTGHSAGEVAASYCAGLYSFADAIRILYHRSHLQQQTSGLGTMLAVSMSEAEADALCQQHSGMISIAAINSAQAITLSGESEILQQIAGTLDEQGQFARLLPVAVPYHSPVMDRLTAPLLAALAGLTPQAPHTALYSTVTTAQAAWQEWQAGYWVKNVRDPVYFSQTIRNILNDGISCFIEVSPHTVLSHAIRDIAGSEEHQIIPLQKRNEDSLLRFNCGMAELYCSGLKTPCQQHLAADPGVSLPGQPWQHQPYWIEQAEVQQARIFNKLPQDAFYPESFPLLGCQLISQQLVWQHKINLQQQSYLRGHQIHGDLVYPGAAYIEAGCQLIQQQHPWPIRMQHVEFNKALYLGDQTQKLETRYDPGSQHIRIFALHDTEWQLHSQMHVQTGPHTPLAAVLDPATLKQQASRHWQAEEFYQHCHQLGMQYQHEFQTVRQIWQRDNLILAELQLQLPTDDMLMPPTLLDGVFQSFFCTVQQAYLPVGIGEIILYRPLPSHCYSLMQVVYDQNGQPCGEISIIDDAGVQLAQLRRIRLTAYNTDTLQQQAELSYRYQWQAVTDMTISSAEPQASLFLHHGTVAELQLLLALQQSGAAINAINMATAQASAATNLLQPYLSSTQRLIFSQLGNTALPPTDSCEVTALSAMFLPTVLWLQAIQRLAWTSAPELLLLTTQAWQLAENAEVQPVQTAWWGLGRVFAAENPQFRSSLLDVADCSAAAIPALAHLLQQPLPAAELAWQQGQLYSHHLEVFTPQAVQQDKLLLLPATTTTTPYRYQPLADRWLAVQSPAQTAAQPLQVRLIGGRGAALTAANGRLLYLAYDQQEQPQLVIASAGICSQLPAQQLQCALTAPQLCTVQQQFAAIQTALQLVALVIQQQPAQLLFYAPGSAGELVALHYAASIVQHVTVITAADLPVAHLPANCTLLQVDQIAPASTDLLICGAGSSLPSALLLAVQPEGTILHNSGLSLPATTVSVIHPSLQPLKALDSSRYCRLIADLIQTLQTLNADNAADKLSPTPAELQPAQLPRGLLMQQDYQLCLRDTDPLYQQLPAETSYREGSYLITGGQGGIGLAVVDFLLQQQAAVIFVSGRGDIQPALASRIAQAAPGQIRYLQADISQSAQVSAMFQQIRQQQVPLRGVYHSAGVLADTLFDQLDEPRLLQVLAPKILGSWHLHLATRHLELDFFICFSSIAAVLGWPGQANYAIANAFMDGLCSWRRQQGLPALSINWGPWAEAGMAAGLASQELARMAQAGMTPLQTTTAIQKLHTVSQIATAQVGIFEQNWDQLSTFVPTPGKTPVYQTLLRHQLHTEVQDIRLQLGQASPEERQLILQQQVAQGLATVLGMTDSSGLDPDSSVFDFGLNSLMAMELKNRLQPLSEVQLPASLVMKQNTIRKLTSFINDLYLNTLQGLDTVSAEQQIKVSL